MSKVSYEVIAWRDACDQMPDADLTVLIAGPFDGVVWLGYWDGSDWRSVDGSRIDQVSYWAEMPVSPVQEVAA